MKLPPLGTFVAAAFLLFLILLQQNVVPCATTDDVPSSYSFRVTPFIKAAASNNYIATVTVKTFSWAELLGFREKPVLDQEYYTIHNSTSAVQFQKEVPQEDQVSVIVRNAFLLGRSKRHGAAGWPSAESNLFPFQTFEEKCSRMCLKVFTECCGFVMSLEPSPLHLGRVFDYRVLCSFKRGSMIFGSPSNTFFVFVRS